MKNHIFLFFISMLVLLSSTGQVISIDDGQTSDLSVPDDFSLDAYSGGFAPWSPWYRIEINSEGEGTYSVIYPEDRFTSDLTIIDQFSLTPTELSMVWDQISTSEFFSLNPLYTEADIHTGSDVIILDGSLANLTIQANGKIHQVETRNIGVSSFDDIMTTLNMVTPTNVELRYHNHVNIPPFTPNPPTGPPEGNAKETYSFTAKTSDLNQDDLYYRFRWGDGSTSDWMGPYQSGEENEFTHTWYLKDTFNVTVQAKDDPNGDGDHSDGLMSGWSDCLQVTMPKTRTDDSVFLQILKWFRDKLSIVDIILEGLFLDSSQPQLKVLNGNPPPTEVKPPEPDTCIIKIIVRIQIWGAGASNETADKIKQDILDKWDQDFKFKCKPEDCTETEPGCDVEFEIDVKYDWKNQSARPPRGNGYHPWWIGDDPEGDDFDPKVYGVDSNPNDTELDYPRPNDATTDAGDPQTISNGCADGYMDNNEPTGTYAHEAGHLLGLADTYEVTDTGSDDDGNGHVDCDERKTKPKDGHENDIMATHDGVLEQWAVDQTINRAGVECPCRCCPETNDSTPPENKIQSPENNTLVSSPLIVQGYAQDGPEGSGIVELDYAMEWATGSMDGASYLIDPPDPYVPYTLGPLHIEIFIDPGDWITITTFAIDAAGNVGEDTVTVILTEEQEDIIPPVTEKTVGQPSWEDGYLVTAMTPIMLDAVDPEPGSGVDHIHYEVWFDSDDDEEVDVMTYEEDYPGDQVEFTFAGTGVPLGLAELRWYAVDNAGNVEDLHTQQHEVIEY